MVVWAARDLRRQPVQTVILFASLATLTLLMGMLLILHQTMAEATQRLTAETPAMVVQRVDTQGRLPIPVDAAVTRIAGIAGVLRPRGRVWGIAQSLQGPVIVLGATREVLDRLPDGAPAPAPGQALAGPGVPDGMDMLSLTPPGRPARVFRIIHRMPLKNGLTLQKTLVLHLADARALFGLAEGQASDLALDVFHDEEAPSMVSEIAKALDWPAQITTRREQMGRRLSDLSRRAGLLLWTFVPAMLAMALLVAALGAWGRQRRWETALFKAVGWTTRDILQLFLYRGLLVGLPAVVSGTVCAVGLLDLPGMDGVAHLLFDWDGPPPFLFFRLQAGLTGLFFVALMAGLPFMTAVFWSGWRAATADPADVLMEGGG